MRHILRRAAQPARHTAAFHRGLCSARTAPILSDERIEAAPGYNRWLQLVPASISGLSIGTYLATPAVLGPHVSRAQGVVAQLPNDFELSAIPTAAVMGGITCAVASIALAPHVASIGTRRFALTASVLFPGAMACQALATQLNSWPAYAFSTTIIGGLGFYCVYPQMPAFLATKWFADGRAGLAVSIYFTAFGSGLFVATPFLEHVLATFRVPPTRLGGLDLLTSDAMSAGASGERLLTSTSGETVACIAATARDLASSGFGGLEEGVFLLDGSNGASEALLSLAALNATLLTISAWGFRLPAQATVAAKATGSSPATASDHPSAIATSSDGAQSTDEAPPAIAPPPTHGMTLADAQLTPQMWLLGLSTFGLAASALPFLSVGKLMMIDIFSGAAAGGSAAPGGGVAALGAGGAAAAAAAVASYPKLIASANMGGRLLWGPIGDALGCGRTLALLGVAMPAALLSMPYATGALVSGGDPVASLTIFRAAACANIGAFAGVPVLLAPACAELYGPQDAGAIYQRISATITLASPIGASVVTRIRDYSYAKHAAALTELCEEPTFVATFGAPTSQLDTLLASKTVTLPLLLHIAPAGTPDPTPLLYDDAFYALGTSAALACACKVLVFSMTRPVQSARQQQ